MRPAARVASGLAAAALLVAAVAGCGRHPRVVYRGDSTGTAAADSGAIVVRNAQQAWDAPGGGEAAAQASARALALELGAHPNESWGATAQSFLDSLGVGAEIAGADCAVAVNFFSRADPSAGSWPWLFWCGAKGPRSQPIEGRSMRLVHLVSRGLNAGGTRDTVPASAAVLFDRRASLGAEPYLVVWGLRGDAWAVQQTLGPDSLGGSGTGEFETRGDSLRLVTRTYRASRGFDECATCPHVFHVREFAWARDGFHRISESEAPSPYSTFVHFVQALVTDDRPTAEALVTDRETADAARRQGLAQAKGLWRVAPASDETATHLVFLRGAAEAYDVQFVQRGGAWLIDAIRTTQATTE